MLSDNRKLGYLALVLTILLFSTLEFVSKTITYDIHPLQINFLRFLAAGLLMLPFTLLSMYKNQQQLSRHDFIKISLLGIINVTFSISLLHVSLLYINASLAAVLFCTNPVFANFFDYLIYRQNLSPVKIAGLFLGTAGMVAIFYTEIFFQSTNLTGIIAALLSAAGYGLYIVLAKSVSDKLGGMIVNCFSFIIGALILMPLLLLLKIPLWRFDLSILPQMLYITLILTIAAYVLFLFGLKFLPAGTGSLIFFAKPPLAILWAFLFLQEAITVPFLIGSFIIMAGIGIYNYDSYKNSIASTAK
ncbi:MAG TPA: DMT family transporter [Syntrophomonadaceae bacterium]|nr:DMT family transporter [Syntrophomonadaceae bacterium]HPR93624.1 DMT family transporter [Syntrophomonadaceae bacterium]